MIKGFSLLLKPYCEGCPNFEAKVISWGTQETGYIHHITCEHKELCEKKDTEGNNDRS